MHLLYNFSRYLKSLRIRKMNNEAIKSSIQSLQQIYTVILALALGEAFKQFVIEGGDSSQRRLDWSKLLSLVALLALIIPFLHGMNRYFFDVYSAGNFPHYGRYLLVDCIAFTLEGGLFFILARSLKHTEFNRFYTTVAILLAFDIFWGGFIWHFHTPSVKPWVIVNLVFGPLITLALILFNKKIFLCPIICAALVVSRSVCDYIFSWPFYFPAS